MICIKVSRSEAKTFGVPVDSCWIEHDFKGDDLLGGCLTIHILAEFPCSQTFCVSLSAMTDKEDPEEETGPLSEEEQEHAMILEAARWMNPEYQRDTLGVPLDKYLEAEYSDPDLSIWCDPDRPQDFLGGETLAEYDKH